MREPQSIVFEPGSKLRTVEDACRISIVNGHPQADVIEIPKLEDEIGFEVCGNGSQFFNNDRGLGLKYSMEKDRDANTGRIACVRITGWATMYQCNRANSIPLAVRAVTSQSNCVCCGKSTKVQADHKDGRKPPMENPTLEDFQPLCHTCNAKKKTSCTRCAEHGYRFDATTIGYPIPFITGRKVFEACGRQCWGCFWHDVAAFRKCLSANPKELEKYEKLVAAFIRSTRKK